MQCFIFRQEVLKVNLFMFLKKFIVVMVIFNKLVICAKINLCVLIEINGVIGCGL